MAKKIVIKSCDDCPNKSHSGGFTTGGAFPTCSYYGLHGKGQEQIPSRIKDCGHNTNILPINDHLRRSYTGEIPEWCPLVQDEQECIEKALIFFDDAMKHVAKFPLQDYQNANELGILLRKLSTEAK